MKRYLFILLVAIYSSTMFGQDDVDIYAKAYAKAKITERNDDEFLSIIRHTYDDLKVRTIPKELLAAYKLNSTPLDYGYNSFDLSYIELWDNVTILHRSGTKQGMVLTESLFIEDDETHERYYEIKGLSSEYDIDFFNALPSRVKSISIGYGNHYFIKNLNISVPQTYKYPTGVKKTVKGFWDDKIQFLDVYRTNDCTIVKYRSDNGKYSPFAFMGDVELIDNVTNQSVGLLGRSAWVEYDSKADMESHVNVKTTEIGILVFPLLSSAVTNINFVARGNGKREFVYAKNVNVTLPIDNNHYASNSIPKIKNPKIISDVDKSIPKIKTNNKNTFAVIIANENYEEETQVEYALNDGEIFKTYCQDVLGLPETNIHYRENATLNNILAELDWMKQISLAFGNEAKFIFYYAGHGIPDEATGDSYLLPVDGRGNMLATGYSLKKLYETSGGLAAKDVTVFMDACFSGAVRNGGMMASARGVAIKAKQSAPQGNMIVFSAAQGDETAYPYKEKGHGLFTYYLLKKLQETKGDVTMGELADYITSEVKKRSIVVNGKLQTPLVTFSNSATDWRNWKLK